MIYYNQKHQYLADIGYFKFANILLSVENFQLSPEKQKFKTIKFTQKIGAKIQNCYMLLTFYLDASVFYISGVMTHYTRDVMRVMPVMCVMRVMTHYTHYIYITESGSR